MASDPLFPPDPSLSVIAPHPTAHALANANASAATAAPIKDAELDTFNPQHLTLPLSNIAKIMKASLPLDAKVSNASKLLVQGCASEFISFLSSDANELVVTSGRRTLNGLDVISAVKRLGFEGYFDALQIYLAKFRTVANESGKRNRRARTESDVAEHNVPAQKRRKLEHGEVADNMDPQDDDEHAQEDDEDYDEE